MNCARVGRFCSAPNSAPDYSVNLVDSSGLFAPGIVRALHGCRTTSARERTYGHQEDSCRIVRCTDGLGGASDRHPQGGKLRASTPAKSPAPRPSISKVAHAARMRRACRQAMDSDGDRQLSQACTHRLSASTMHYLTVRHTALTLAAWTTAYDYYGLYWGSVDTYNYLSFYLGDACWLIRSAVAELPPLRRKRQSDRLGFKSVREFLIYRRRSVRSRRARRAPVSPSNPTIMRSREPSRYRSLAHWRCSRWACWESGFAGA